MPPVMSAARKIRVQEVIFVGFLGSFVLLRLIRLIRRRRARMLQKLEDSGSESTDEVRVKKGARMFTQTKGDTEAGLGWKHALPYYFPSVIALLDVIERVRMGSAGWAVSKPPNGLKSPWQKFKGELFVAFGLLPMLECFVSQDWSNLTDDEQRKHPKRDLKFRIPLFLWSAVNLVHSYISLAAATDLAAPVNLRDRISLAALSGWVSGSMGITYAHELIHKKDLAGWAAGHALLVNCGYTHWAQEHLVGHHKNVATPADPATARRGESFYAFLPRTLVGSLKGAWGIERERLRELHGREGELWWLTPHNRVLAGAAASAAWAGLIARLSGRRVAHVMAAFGVQSAVAVTLLEAVNYIEHYGLLRKKLESGEYEPVDPTHSWNSPHRLSNTLLLKLQRHSDHHTFAGRPYEVLRNFKESPQLPSGYPGMVALACIPPVFRWVMDPLADAYNAKEGVEEAQHEAERKMWWVSPVLLAVMLRMVTSGT